MKFNVCGKFLNDYEKYNEKLFPFIKMLIKHLIEIKNENLNNLTYFLFKNDSNEELTYFIFKTFIENLINVKSINSNLNFDFFLYLSIFKTKKIETKFLIIKIFQLLYLKKNKEINEIFSQKSNLKGQMFYFILLHFFECSIILDSLNLNKNINEINNETPNGNYLDNKNMNEIETDKGRNINSKEKLMFKLIKKYIIFSIQYIGSFHFNIEIPKNFQYELYIKIISEDLEELIEKNIENKNIVSLYNNEITKKCLLNIFLDSMNIYNQKNEINENLKSYLLKIMKHIKSLLIKIIVDDINNNIGYINKESKEKKDSFGFKTFNLLIKKIFKKNQNPININIIFQIIDELMSSSFSQITKIDPKQFQNITTMTIKDNLFNGFIVFFNNLLTNSMELLKTLKQPKIKKYSEIKKCFDKKKTFIDFIKNEYFNIENFNNLNKKMEQMIKILNAISMTFIQFFVKKKIEEQKMDVNDVDNLNFYLIFLYIMIELVEFLMNNKLCNIPKDSKAIIRSNLINFCYNNFLILSYLYLKQSRRKIFSQIMIEILENSLPKHKNDNQMVNDIHYISKYNPYIFMIEIFHIVPDIKDLTIDNIIKHYFNIEKKTKQQINFELQIQLPNIKNLWDNSFMPIYNISNYSNYIILQKKYIKIKKELFTWNGIYSNHTLFYTEQKKNFKYKISTHLTNDYVNPILKPILDFNYYTSNKFQIHNFCSNDYENYINLSIFNNKNIQEFEIPLNYEKLPCCLVKATHHIKGFILIKKEKDIKDIKDKYLEFFYSEKEEIKQNYDETTHLCYGSFSNINENILYYLKIKINDINFILTRKYYFTNNSIEIFTNKNKSYFFTFNTENGQSRFISMIKDDLYNMKEFNMNCFVNFKKLEKHTYLINNWFNNKISTFKYINFVNILSNRSLKDLTQYPVFPWILHDYSIKEYDKKEKKPKIRIRQLNLPMAQIGIDPLTNESNRKNNYETNFDVFIDDLDEKLKNYTMEQFYQDDNVDLDKIPYYYGTHYSNPAYVSHYLTRIFPYTITAWSIQGTSFDAPDRLFINIEKSYYSSVTSRSDLREIIPQFFYLPEMFLNINKLNLGTLQTNHDKDSTFIILKEKCNYNNLVYVNDVLIPKYANGNPYIFVSLYREILENIKIEICDWINLYFGINSRGEKGREHKNLFMAYTYDNVIENKIKLIKDPQEKDCTIRLVELGLAPHQIYDKLISFEEEKINIQEIDISLKLNDVNQIKNIIKVNDSINFFTTELNYVSLNLKTKKSIEIQSQITFIIDRIIYVSKGDFYISLVNDTINNKFVLKIKLNPYMFSQIMNENIVDKSLFSIIYVDKNEDNLYIGTENGSLIIYNMEEIIQKDGLDYPKYFLHHSKKINFINVNNDLNMLIDCSDDGYINLYTLPKMELVNSIYREDIIYNVFLSSSPLPSFITFSNKKFFDCYNINCENINAISPYEKITIKNENNNNKIEKICDIQISDNKSTKYLEEKGINNLNNAIITSKNFVDYLIYEAKPFYIIRKFPFMIMCHKIHFNEGFDRSFVIEDIDDIKFIKIMFEQNKISVISYHKSKIASELFSILK